MSRRLGETVELPWWTFVLGIPPLAVLVLALVLRGSVTAVLVGGLGSAGMLVVLVAVTLRVRSTHMQAVYISGVYAVWFFLAVFWGLLVWASAPSSCGQPVQAAACALPQR